MGALTIVTPAGAEPVLLVDAKLHLRVDITDDDTLINAQLSAVRERVEQLTARRMITQTLKWTLDRFPRGSTLNLPVAPVSAINTIKFFDELDTEFTVDATTFIEDTTSTPARVVLRSEATWPDTTLREANGVEVEFVVGYGTAGTDVPQGLLEGIKILQAVLYENREEVLPVVLHKLPLGARSLIEQFLWDPFRTYKINPEVDRKW